MRNHTCRLIVLAAFVGLAAQLTQANIITITSTSDNVLGTLREALASAVDGDTIDNTGVSGAVVLTSGELLVNNSVTILGPGPNNLAVAGNAASRLFDVSSNLVVSISGLTITNGYTDTGGGIAGYGSALTMINCTTSGNPVALLPATLAVNKGTASCNFTAM